MKVTLIILNLSAALPVLPAMSLVRSTCVMDVSLAYTALDRERVPLPA